MVRSDDAIARRRRRREDRSFDMNATTGQDEDAAIRERLERGFAGRATVRIVEAAGFLNMTEKTLRRHVTEGNVAFRSTGTGSVRIRREFALSDLLGFYAARKTRGAPPADPRGRTVMRAGTGLTGFLATIASAPPQRRVRTARGGRG
jgi:hypothetical protein